MAVGETTEEMAGRRPQQLSGHISTHMIPRDWNRAMDLLALVLVGEKPYDTFTITSHDALPFAALNEFLLDRADLIDSIRWEERRKRYERIAEELALAIRAR